jgi:hypothetical protein
LGVLPKGKVRKVSKMNEPLRIIDCSCGEKIGVWNSYDQTCDCGQRYNCFGQKVKYSLAEIDFLDAGEEW